MVKQSVLSVVYQSAQKWPDLDISSSEQSVSTTKQSKMANNLLVFTSNCIERLTCRHYKSCIFCWPRLSATPIAVHVVSALVSWPDPPISAALDVLHHQHGVLVMQYTQRCGNRGSGHENSFCPCAQNLSVLEGKSHQWMCATGLDTGVQCILAFKSRVRCSMNVRGMCSREL